MEEDNAESRYFTTFEKHDELLGLQRDFLSLDLRVDPINSVEDSKEYNTLRKLQNILDEYQEQSYLLDPHLEGLVLPVVERVKAYAHATVHEGSKFSSARVERLCLLLYGYIKFRGYKNIIKFFPHEIADLTIVMGFMLHPNGLLQHHDHWALRYIIFLWLSLVCMIPFDLAQFDDVDQSGHTARTLEQQARDQLNKAGLERDGAALLLSRLYVRKDTSTMFRPFLQWSLASLETAQDPFLCIGILQVLCEVAKSASAEEIQELSPDLLRIGHLVDDRSSLSNNTVARKFTTKLVSRIGLRILPARPSRQKGRLLTPMETEDQSNDTYNDLEVSDDVESALEHLFESLQDKSTLVRWTAAKGVARISERLPPDFVDQVLETIISHFSIHSVVAASLYDLPAVAESTWHGACLACAEMARRSLVSPQHLPSLIEWTTKALYFDLRKGSHSIGSNVRDAAAYVLWALARSQDSRSLLPHTEYLAQRLVTVAVYDREIHIRRAASAAFQELVGRTGSVPHGIDVLREIDFYAVSIRRNAFLTAAPAVAMHQEYREFLFNHLIDVTLRHWDPTMRKLGSQSLRLLSLTNLGEYGPKAEEKISRLLESVDNSDLHGALLALSELAVAYRTLYYGDELEGRMGNVFRFLARIPKKTVMGPRHELVTAAACLLISNTITLTEIELGTKSSVPDWRKIVDYGIKHRSSSVQEAAAKAFGSISQIIDSSQTVERLIRGLQSASPIVRQSLGRCLGALAYDKHRNALPRSIQCILECVNPNSALMKNNVEGRRNCYDAIPQIISTVAPNISAYIPSHDFQQLFDALLNGLTDYTSDERGDVGSWIRIACVRGLAAVSETVLRSAASLSELEEYLPPLKYHSAISGILKQGVERLDNVRQDAGKCFLRLLRLKLPAIASTQWQIEQGDLFRTLFPDGQDINWGDGSLLYPKAVRFLDVAKYRAQVLPGLILSLGSKTDSTHRPVASSLIEYCQDLPLASLTTGYSLLALAEDILNHGRSKATSNAVVIPVLQTFHVLLEADSFIRLDSDEKGAEMLEALLAFCCKNIASIKNTQRIHESMKIVVHLLGFRRIYSNAVSSLKYFLTHRFPSVRSDTAEYLYLFMQSTELEFESDTAEEILLETEWSSEDVDIYEESSRTLIDALKKDVDVIVLLNT